MIYPVDSAIRLSNNLGQGNRELKWLVKLNPELSSDCAGMRSLAVLYGPAQSFYRNYSTVFGDRVQGLYTLSMIYIKLGTLLKAFFPFFKFSAIRVSSFLVKVWWINSEDTHTFSRFLDFVSSVNLPYPHWLVSVALPSVRGTWWDWTLGSHRPDAMLHTDWIINHQLLRGPSWSYYVHKCISQWKWMYRRSYIVSANERKFSCDEQNDYESIRTLE